MTHALKRGRSGSFDLYSENSQSPSRPRGGSVSRDSASVGGGGGAAALNDATKQKILHAERMRIALQNMSEGQRDRFEFFTRSHFDKEVIRKIMLDAFQTVRNTNVEGFVGDSRNLNVDINDQMVIVMSALSKMFVGDLVHGARQVMDERGEEGAIHPRHLREAYRRAVRDKKLPTLSTPGIF